jgi:PIN domain
MLATGKLLTMRLKEPGSVDHAIQTLTTVKDQLYNCRPGSAATVLDNWLSWWEMADAQLRSLFTENDAISSLYQTRLEIAHNGADTRFAQREINVWIARFEEMISNLQAVKVFIGRRGQIVVPDTSAFIEGEYFDQFDWHSLKGVARDKRVRLIVPILVIEELDAKKTDRNNRVSSRARSVLRRLWELHGSRPAQPARIPNRDVTVEVFLDDAWHLRRPVNDDEIVERAVAIKETTGRSVLLVSGDYKMLYRAAAAGLGAALMPRPVNAEAEPR